MEQATETPTPAPKPMIFPAWAHLMIAAITLFIRPASDPKAYVDGVLFSAFYMVFAGFMIGGVLYVTAKGRMRYSQTFAQAVWVYALITLVLRWIV
jgi:hypothetical protein